MIETAGATVGGVFNDRVGPDGGTREAKGAIGAMVLRIGRGELPAGCVAAIMLAVLVFALDLNPWFAIVLAVGIYLGIVLLWPQGVGSRSASSGADASPEQVAYEEALTDTAAIRVLAARIAGPEARDRVVRILDHADRILVAMNEDGNLAAAPLFDDKLLKPFRAAVTEYVRLSGRDVKSAIARNVRAETCILPMFEKAVDAFDEELNRASGVDLAVLEDALDSNLRDIDTSPLTIEQAPAVPSDVPPDPSDASSATGSFSPDASAARAAARFGLTPREHEIVVLLAQRLTNPEIADLLSIALRTAENHVHNILDKLGLKSRREVPAFAAKHGLLPPPAPPAPPE